MFVKRGGGGRKKERKRERERGREGGREGETERKNALPQKGEAWD